MEMKRGPIYQFPSADHDLPITIALIGINYCNSNYLNIRKKSRITVLGYVLSGEGNVTLDDSSFHPKKGDVFVLPAGRYHRVFANPESEEPWNYIWFNIKGDLAVALLHAYRLSESIVVSDMSAGLLFQRAIQLAQSEKPQEMLDIMPIIFLQIVIRLSNTKNERKNSYSEEVQKIKHFLNNQIQIPFNSNQLSKHIGLSFKQINRLFKKETGTTVYNYVLMKKIDAAKMMLLDTPLTVNEICYHLGYADPQYFSNLFKKKTGMSPSIFRSQNKTH
ncbi:AraC family transcriptional regulator [Paenibacillus allorhizosphaerae]|uniref:Arabinose operon regulatory protein n=1 Tax=Paenibacillus allorhizosphaerae TaxID=2849866 RepID=A0ABM8VR14_9BACL|nr:AraC family transcriptional regulator [Paenibacillus allorhizosphaerae]CAG7654832.1 Arabinose operon regulatory protein [Paenibacillus allorhizosphaerae]